MRIYFKSTERPKAIAKTLQRSMEFLGKTVTLSAAKAIVASMYGYRDWRELDAEAGRQGQSPPDGELDQGEREAREQFQIAKLTMGGCSAEHAAYLVRTIRPTAAEKPDFSDLLAVYDHFENLNSLIGATGYRLYANGDMHGVVAYRLGREWRSDPVRRTHIADFVLSRDPTLGGISAVWPQAVD